MLSLRKLVLLGQSIKALRCMVVLKQVLTATPEKAKVSGFMGF